MPNLTLLDWAKRLDPKGTVPIIANILSQTNEILEDCVMIEGNLPTGHRLTIATGLPETYYRALNRGIPTSRGTTVQVDENMAMAEARSEIDLDLVMLNGNSAAFRMSEGRLFIESMNQTIASGMFYGNPAIESTQFLGLTQRYNDLTAGNKQNILDAGGTGALALTSVWLVGWSDQTTFCTFPKGSKAGLLQEDLGRQTSYNVPGPDGTTDGSRMEVMAERYQWKIGLAVKDWRSVCRIANLETSDFANLTGNMAPTNLRNLLHLMALAISKIPKGVQRTARLAFYMNSSVFAVLQRVALEKSHQAVTIQQALDQFGKPAAMLTFMGIPIRQADAIVNTESQAA